MVPRLLCASLVLTFAASALAWTYDFDDDGIKGVLSRGDDGALATSCFVIIDRPPEKVVATLTDYDNIGAWVPGTVEYKVLKREGTGARFYRRSEAPFFMPQMWANVDVTVKDAGDGKTRVEWHRIEGTIEIFDASFDVEPAPGGSKVTYTVRTSVPLPAPAFILKRAGAKAIADTLKGLRSAARKRA